MVGLDSYKQDLIANDDGTVDVYFAADPPTGQDGNWIKTRSGEPFFVMFRVYGPKKEAVDGSWMLNDVENAGIVVDDEDRSQPAHETGTASRTLARSSTIRISVPLPGAESTSMRPSRLRTVCRTIASPSPKPSASRSLPR